MGKAVKVKYAYSYNLHFYCHRISKQIKWKNFRFCVTLSEETQPNHVSGKSHFETREIRRQRGGLPLRSYNHELESRWRRLHFRERKSEVGRVEGHPGWSSSLLPPIWTLGVGSSAWICQDFDMDR